MRSPSLICHQFDFAKTNRERLLSYALVTRQQIKRAQRALQINSPWGFEAAFKFTHSCVCTKGLLMRRLQSSLCLHVCIFNSSPIGIADASVCLPHRTFLSRGATPREISFVPRSQQCVCVCVICRESLYAAINPYMVARAYSPFAAAEMRVLSVLI